MIEGDPHLERISGEFGWGDSDDGHANPMTTALLLLVTCSHWSLVWLFSGLVHLPWIAGDWRVQANVKRNRS